MATYLEIVIAYLNREQKELRQQIDLFTTGRQQVKHRKPDGTWSDATQKELKRTKEKLAEIEGILASRDQFN